MNGESLNRFGHMIEKTYYDCDRYSVEATFALMYHEKPLEMDDQESFVRISDHIINVDDHHDFIIFAFTGESNAQKAASKLLNRLDGIFKDRSCCIALDSFDPSKTPPIVLNRLRQILSETRKHSFARIENESILDSMM